MGLRVRRVPRHRGPAAWDAILPPGPTYPALHAQKTADVVVVGAGFAGLSAVRRVQQIDPTARIVLLEAGRIGEGAAGRNSGFMIDLPHELSSADYAGAGDDRALIALNRSAIGFGRDAVEDFGIDPNFFDPAGKVNGAASSAAQRHNRSYAAHLARLGEPFEMLDRQQMQELTGSAHYRSGLYTAGTVMLQPAGYVRGLAAGLHKRGTQVFEETPVTRMARMGTDWEVRTPSGGVTAPRVILAVNGHLESFGLAQNRLMQIFLFATMTPELSATAVAALGGAPRWGITPSDPMGTTVRRIDTGQGGNRIVTRTCAVMRSNMAATSGDLRRAAQVMQTKFDTRFPQLSGMKMAYAWAGHLCLSRNGVAIMQEVEEGVFSACVQNGLGTTRGTLTGMGAAERALGVESEVTRHFTVQAAPHRLPPAPLRDVGANAVLRFREWRAAAE
ncbi:MAG: FAD-binding oxidoreductase [Pseudomonadota bacterium]